MRRYRFVVREYPIYKVINQKLYTIDCVGIGLEDEERNIIVPSPLTNFIRNNYRSKKSGSVSSQNRAAYAICLFLNYCRDSIEEEMDEFLLLKGTGISGLTLEHGYSFISYLSFRSREGQLKASYVKGIKGYINKFYAWLQEENLLETNIKVSYKTMKRITNIDGEPYEKEIIILRDMFENDDLGSDKITEKLSDFGKDRSNLVKEFLDVALDVSEDIYLGICFQFFGGLRRGEVVNLTRDSLLNKPQGKYLDVDDNQDLLFPNKKNTKSEQVKKKRFQPLFWNSVLEYAYREQIAKLKVLEKKKKLNNRHALLVSSRTGNPITGYAYWYQFNRVKRAFLKKILNEGRIDTYQKLSDIDWSTHLTRGVFTHFCFDAGLSISQTALARGDSNLNSMLDYIEGRTIQETLTDALNIIRVAFEKAPNRKITAEISYRQMEKWKGEFYGG